MNGVSSPLETMPPDRTLKEKHTQPPMEIDRDGLFQPWDPESNDVDAVSQKEGRGEVEYKTCEWW